MQVRAATVVIAALSLASCAWAQEAPPTTAPNVPPPPQTEAEKAELLDRVVTNQKKDEAAMLLYERIEHVEVRKSASDPAVESKISRVIPAGTGVDHLPIGPDGKPTDPDAYHSELIKLEKALSWAADDGHAQQDAYDKLNKKLKERDELIDATRTAFIFTFVGTETRASAVLYKFRMEPNPTFKPSSRATTIFAKVHGFVWIDPVAGQMARVEGEVTGDINIGLFLAKVYKGSHFMQERYEMAPGVWLPSFSQYDFDGRKLFSSLYFHERTFYRQYRRIGPPKEALASIRAELSKPGPAPTDP
jgi:hypothetical protein